MARSKGAVYSGSLKLDKVVGIRHDLGQRAIPAKNLLKKDTSFKTPEKSMKTSENTFRGKKY
jgi:hypothetical protein